MSNRQSVTFGACTTQGESISPDDCVVDRSSCVRTKSYLSKYELDTSGTSSNTKCTASKVKSGTCRSNKICSNNSRSCGASTGFREDHKCNLETNTQDNTATVYGGCQDNVSGEITCVWDVTDCTESETFKSVLELLEMGKPCYCDSVVTGLCNEPNGVVYCAPQATSCGADSDFVSARRLMLSPENYYNVDCRLCDALNSQVLKNSQNAHVGSSSSSNNTGVIVGSIVGVLAFVVIGALVFVAYRKKKASTLSTTMTEANIDVAMETPNSDTEPETSVSKAPTPPEIT